MADRFLSLKNPNDVHFDNQREDAMLGEVKSGGHVAEFFTIVICINSASKGHKNIKILALNCINKDIY